MNDEIAPTLAGARLATGHMPIPATNAQQEPVRAGVASTCTTCSVVSVRGARSGTASFAGGAPWRENPNAPSRSTAACSNASYADGAGGDRTRAREPCAARPADGRPDDRMALAHHSTAGTAPVGPAARRGLEYVASAPQRDSNPRQRPQHADDQQVRLVRPRHRPGPPMQRPPVNHADRTRPIATRRYVVRYARTPVNPAVEVMGFEPTTSSMRPKRSSQLSYTPETGRDSG